MQVLQIYSQEKVPRTLLSPRFFFDLVEVIILQLLININFERVLIFLILIFIDKECSNKFR